MACAFVQLGTASSAQEAVTYTYDALGRLKASSATSTFDSLNIQYQYDAAGNRTNVAVQTNGPRTLNGDFEVPAVNGFAYAPNAPSLTFKGLAGIAAYGSAWGFPPPWAGSQVAFLQAAHNTGGSLEVKAVHLNVGRRYQIVFAAARRPGYSENSLRIYVDNVLVWNAPPPTASHFSPFPTQSFIAVNTTAVVRFEATPTAYDSASAIDAVNVQQLD